MNRIKQFLIANAMIIPSIVSFDLMAEDKPSEVALEKEERVSIDWVEPKKYRDVRSPNMSRKRFREQVFNDLHEFFNELATELPEGKRLALTVTNVDLAGTVQVPSQIGIGGSLNFDRGFDEYRVLRDVDIPRLNFSYTLLDADGNELKSETVKLKDMNYLRNASIRRSSESLRYEKQMIEKWFERTFFKQS
ncbi:DUF3016 domain-containing protein [Glaciecola sp. MH2013]|uniref:DUF3016 domain-containing protein n=1 Tax=Glaciecola sp. MH2013 TaxID=2785524 RepID=UPI00189C74F2|nr:DUF3016 domain-containing protein [Glaciecola sp. MH2013]MBF7071908.1 DUF3016 domain-containing protein [Glaciecola sp. MH2013]